MNRRFIAQKKATPSTPLAFDFSEVGMPSVREISNIIDKKRVELDALSEKLKTQGSSYFWIPNSIVKYLPEPVRLAHGKKLLADVEIGQKYLASLKSEVDKIIDRNKVNYIELLQLSYFSSRATGYFDRLNYSYKFKILMISEYLLQGYKDLPMAEEYQMYLERDFKLFQYRSANGSTRIGAEMIKEAFANKDKLEVIFLPTHLSVNLNVFYRLQPHFIYPLGIADHPISADGVLRHGGLFYAHDLGHSGLMYKGAAPYQGALAEAQVKLIRAKMDTWYSELLAEMSKVEDPALRVAIRQASFNIHHERGYPFAPSTYIILKEPPKSSYLLFFLFELSGQMRSLGNRPYLMLPKAHQWLKDFWKEREDQEREIRDLVL